MKSLSDRRKFLQLSLIVINVIECAIDVSASSQRPDSCDELFHLTIDKEPEFYVPRSTYIVGIESNNVYTFSSFELTSEPVNSNSSISESGWFTIMHEDERSQFSPDAINTIVEIDHSPKQNIHVLWTAPGSGNCLFFKAKIIYETKYGQCSQKIKRSLCGLRDGNQSFNLSSEDECCACDEATYNLIFEGLWSNETHPKDFPVAVQLTHFSDVIGCTHSKNLTMWAEGQYASEGLRQIAEFGSGSIMESELLEKRKYLRSLIKMSGLWYPRMNSNATAKLRVDKRHNLLSLASMLGPSPDWFTGVSKLNLCSKDCSWIDWKVVDLPLYDAGTDNGISYMAPNSPSVPRERVYRITGSYPEDPRAPFCNMHVNNIKPIARLYIKREQITQKSCMEEPLYELDPNEETDFVADKRPECATTNYTEWSPCSATCGKGVRAKTRNYVDPQIAKQVGCNLQLMSKKLCVAPSSCPGVPEDDSLLFSDNQCKTGNWSEWSECTSTCGIGFMTRTRKFLKRSSFKKCKHVSVYETKKCMEPPCKTTTVEKEFANCTTTEWSEWSPCSVTCGKGVRIRIRRLIVSTNLIPQCERNVKLIETRACVKTEGCVTNNKNQTKEICTFESDVGPCRGLYERWYYDSQAKQCVQFEYGGCRGNRNNFLTQNDCVEFCSGV